MNVWGQDYAVYVRQPRAGELVGVVLTRNGQQHSVSNPKFGATTVPATATLVGGEGGFVPTGDVPGQSSSSLLGAFGGWQLDLTGMGIPSPGAGHLGYLTSFSPSQLSQDFLYRVAVPGAPELNAMQTELDMTDHAIRGIRETQFVAHSVADLAGLDCTDPTQDGRMFLHDNEGLYLCRDGRLEVVTDSGNSIMGREVTIADNDETIAKPVCPADTDLAPQIYVSHMAVGTTAALSAPIIAVQTWASDLDADNWQVHMRIKTDDIFNYDVWQSPAPDVGKILVLTSCEHP